MAPSAQFLAFDLGAESGRVMRGRLDSGLLDLSEVHRFPNEPVRQNGSLQWDVLRLWLEIKRGLERTSAMTFDSVGVDAWGCDFALVGEQGALVQNPYHYRDKRTDGVMEAVFKRVPAEKIYAVTGIQFLQINTLYQLYAACQSTPRLVAAATTLGTIPDLVNFWLTGDMTAEFTNATTTQFVDARTRSWAADLMRELDLPTRLLPRIVEPGTVVGRIVGDAPASLVGTPVVAPACHDTGSAVAAVRADGHRAFISSGTWSLVGTELDAPVITPRACELNFTNEGGVCGTTRLLKNIAGLWLLQSCRRDWAERGLQFGYDELLTLASEARTPFRSLFDPDHPSFLHPRSMVAAIAEYCRDTRQPEPDGPGAYARAILESLAFKYRVVIESMEQLTGVSITEIRVVGGGARNRLLNQFTADSTGRTVVAGPVEASALGNIAMQMVATGAVASLAEARQIIERSFPVERFEPIDRDRWHSQYRRFHGYLEPTCV
jgi:rhamnulokinase